MSVLKIRAPRRARLVDHPITRTQTVVSATNFFEAQSNNAPCNLSGERIPVGAFSPPSSMCACSTVTTCFLFVCPFRVAVKMEVRVTVRDKRIDVKCGEGTQPVRWLADVALARYAGNGIELGSLQLAVHLCVCVCVCVCLPAVSEC